MTERSTGTKAVILDVDGTLVDTNYHHAVAWYRALRQAGAVLPLFEIHRHMGMGGDQVVAALTSEAFDEEHGEEVRAAEKALFKQLTPELEPLEGARDLVTELKRRGLLVVLASSAKQSELDVYLDLLDVRDVADDWTSSADVEASKPHPDLVHAALEKAGTDPGEALMIGDTPWDCEAAGRAGVRTVTVLTGGFSEPELREAGASAVYRTMPELTGALDDLLS
jgi:HAD superfamily hydrolase (TIGR01509 family)